MQPESYLLAATALNVCHLSPQAVKKLWQAILQPTVMVHQHFRQSSLLSLQGCSFFLELPKSFIDSLPKLGWHRLFTNGIAQGDRWHPRIVPG